MYIGSSFNLWGRIQHHLCVGSNLNYTHISLLYRAVQKYSWDRFKLVILEFTNNTTGVVFSREQFYLDFYRPYYNILSEAGSSQGFQLSEETKYKMSLAKGFSIYVYSYDCSTLLYTFSSIRKAAKSLQISDKTIIKYIQNNCVYDNKWVFSFTLLELDFQPLEKIKSAHIKGTTIYAYKDSTFIQSFISANHAAKYFGVNYYTILKYARNSSLFQYTFILSLTPLSQESLSNFMNQKNSKLTQSMTIYLYSLDSQLLSTFSSAAMAAKF